MIIFEGDWILPKGSTRWYRVVEIAELDHVGISIEGKIRYIEAIEEKILKVQSHEEFVAA